MKLRFLILITVGFLYCLPAHATNCMAASTSAADVQTAVNLCIAGGTVIVPSGSSAWAQNVSISPLAPLTIQGQTTCTGSPASSCTDNTNITINNPGRLIISSSAAHLVTITGFTFTIAGADFNNGAIGIFGALGQVSFRFHHSHIVCNSNVSTLGLIFIGSAYGLFDHLLVSNSGTGNHTFAIHGDRGDAGNSAWNLPVSLGTGNAVYFEDSTFNNLNQTDGLMDGYTGGRVVFRHNVVTQGNAPGADNIGFHGTDSGSLRSFFSVEIYSNTFTNNSSNTMTPLRSRGGTSLTYSNTWAGSGGWSAINLQNYRADGGTNFSSWGPVNGTNWQPQTYPCGQAWAQNCANVTGGGIFWCNINRDTVAISNATCNAITPGDTATAYFDTNAPRDNIGRTHNQVLAPVYEWLNSPDPGIGSCCSSQLANYIKANQDYYSFTGSFTGATGIGSGSLAARPGTCTAGPGGNTPGVGYWATDTSTLYVCNPTNTWSTYYKPYAYPHPLQGGVQAGGGPTAPTNLAAVVQ
jgi:hypothetical protein